MGDIMSTDNHECWESEYASDIVSDIHERPVCLFCKDPNQPIDHAKLCSHCYRLKLNLRKVEAKVKGLENDYDTASIESLIELKVAEAKIKDAHNEGVRYGDINQRRIDGITLEYEFAFLSECLIGKNLFHGDATLFDNSLTPDQRQFVFYMLSQISRVYRKRHRRQNAYGDAFLEYYKETRF
jgi:hypothetical protein